MNRQKTHLFCLLIVTLCVSCTGTRQSSILPTQISSQATDQSAGIDRQIEETLQTVREQMSTINDPVLQTQTEEKLQPLIDMSLQEIEFERANGTTSTNSAGEQIFVGASVTKFDYVLRNLEYQAEAMVKWAGFRGRSFEERQDAARLVTSFVGNSVSYAGYRPFAYDPLRIVEWYQSDGIIYEVDIEADQIVHFAPENDALPAQSGSGLSNRADYKAKSEEIIHQLAPDIDLERLTLRTETADSPYFHWEDRQAAPLLSGDLPFVEVVWRSDDTAYSFTNTIFVMANSR
jgi:hypothetical protein